MSLLPEHSATHFLFYIRPNNYQHTLLAWQTKPTEAFIFKGKEISYEDLVALLDNAEVPEKEQDANPVHNKNFK